MRKGIAWGAAALVMGGALVVPATSAHAATTGLKMCMETPSGDPVDGQVTADGPNYLTHNTNDNGCYDFGDVPVGLYQVRSDAKQADPIPNCGTLYYPACPHVFKFDHIEIKQDDLNKETYSDPTVVTRLHAGDNVKVTFVWK